MELPITLEELTDWLSQQDDKVILGHTHSASHCFLCPLLKQKFNTRAVYINETNTKVCKLSEWTEYTNPNWLKELIQSTNALHKYDRVNRFNVPPLGLGKPLTKKDILSCLRKAKPKKRKVA